MEFESSEYFSINRSAYFASQVQFNWAKYPETQRLAKAAGVRIPNPARDTHLSPNRICPLLRLAAGLNAKLKLSQSFLPT